MQTDVDYTAELVLLLQFTGSIAAALSLFAMNGCKDMSVKDVNSLLAATKQISKVATSIAEGCSVKVAVACSQAQKSLEAYSGSSDTFSYWASVVDLNYAIRLIEAVRSKAKAQAFRSKLLEVGLAKAPNEATFWS
jgi:hypothetical protein